MLRNTHSKDFVPDLYDWSRSRVAKDCHLPRIYLIGPIFPCMIHSYYLVEEWTLSSGDFCWRCLVVTCGRGPSSQKQPISEAKTTPFPGHGHWYSKCALNGARGIPRWVWQNGGTDQRLVVDNFLFCKWLCFPFNQFFPFQWLYPMIYMCMYACANNWTLSSSNDIWLAFFSTEDNPKQKDGEKNTVTFRVVYKKNVFNVSFELDQLTSKLKEHIHKLTGVVYWWCVVWGLFVLIVLRPRIRGFYSGTSLLQTSGTACSPMSVPIGEIIWHNSVCPQIPPPFTLKIPLSLPETSVSPMINPLSSESICLLSQCPLLPGKSPYPLPEYGLVIKLYR